MMKRGMEYQASLLPSTYSWNCRLTVSTCRNICIMVTLCRAEQRGWFSIFGRFQSILEPILSILLYFLRNGHNQC
jgi:hypothetical protein